LIAAPPAFSRAQSPAPDPAHSAAGPPPFTFSSTFSAPFNQHDSQVPAFSYFPPSRVDRFFEEGSDVPRAEIQAELFGAFFDRLGSHFPFLTRQGVDRLNHGDPSATVDAPMLINAVCALGARFASSDAVRGPDRGLSPALYGVPFADKAKAMLVPLLGYPSTRTVQSLILLSWHEFGLNNDGVFWSFVGMALRMAQDLGLHLDIEHPHADRRELAVDRLTWWAVVGLDRMLSLGTGRPVTIKSHEITVQSLDLS